MTQSAAERPSDGAILASAGGLPAKGPDDETRPRLGRSARFWCAAIAFAWSLAAPLWLLGIAAERTDPRLGAVGDVGEILYDRDRPGDSVWVRRVEGVTPAT